MREVKVRGEVLAGMKGCVESASSNNTNGSIAAGVQRTRAGTAGVMGSDASSRNLRNTCDREWVERGKLWSAVASVARHRFGDARARSDICAKGASAPSRKSPLKAAWRCASRRTPRRDERVAARISGQSRPETGKNGTNNSAAGDITQNPSRPCPNRMLGAELAGPVSQYEPFPPSPCLIVSNHHP